MKTLLLLILLLAPHAQAANLKQVQTDDLLCGLVYADAGLSCVSKVSIRADQLRAELLSLQIVELKSKQLTNKKKPVSINN